MSTYQIFVSTDGGESFTYCNVTGIFKTLEHAEIAAKVMEGLSPGIYQVRQAKRGRKKGQKDVVPRKLRTPREEILARIIETTGEPVDVSANEATDDEVPAVLATSDYVETTESQLDEAMRDREDAGPVTVSPGSIEVSP